MEAFALARFGAEISRRVIEPIITRTYGRAAREISTLAAALLRLDRVVMFNEPFFKELMGSPRLRACVAYPEQRNLDLAFASGRGSYYPRAFGIHRVIDALVDRCQSLGVEILTSTSLRHVRLAGSGIRELALDGGRTVASSQVHWSAGVIPLARQLGVMPANMPSDPPMTTAIVNFLFDHPGEMGDLYYFYCLDAGYRTYRVTNFTAYCPGAPRAGGFPLCVELLLPPGHSTDGEALKAEALKELRDFGILPSWTRTLFSDVKVLERGFPLPSLANMALIEASRKAVIELGLENLTMLGVLSKPKVFFQTEVVRDVYQTLMGGQSCVA
jgi:protoporphyrinogen oxidase